MLTAFLGNFKDHERERLLPPGKTFYTFSLKTRHSPKFSVLEYNHRSRKDHTTVTHKSTTNGA